MGKLWQFTDNYFKRYSFTGFISDIRHHRALAVLGAGKKYGFPCLVIDAGTALTFTGVDRDKKLVGGAIDPG